MHDLEIIEMLRNSVANFIDEHRQLPGKEAVPGKLLPLDRGLWLAMGDLGWLGLALPESQGGSGLGIRESTVLAQLFGQSAMSVPFISAVIMPSMILAKAKGEVVESIAAQLISGERVVTVAWQELSGAMQPWPQKTTFSSAGLSGRKVHVPVASENAIVLVTAQHGETPVVVAVDMANGPNVKSTAATALGTVSEIIFDDVEVLGGAALLEGAEAVAALSECLEAGRIALAAQLAGLADGCLRRTIEHVTDRQQFGQPLGAKQAIKHRCSDMYIASLLAHASWQKALAEYERDPAASTTLACISAAKARCADTAMDVTRGSVQLHGAMGFTEEGGIGAYLRIALAGSGWLGSSTAHRRRFFSIEGAA